MKDTMFLYKGAWVNSVPPHLCQKMTKDSMQEYLKQGGFFVRNTFDFDTPAKTSFWFVIKDSFHGMEELSSRTRNKIRRAFKIYDIKRVSAQEMLRVGHPVFNSALEHYKVKAAPITLEAFEQRINQEEAAGNTDFWCVYEKESGKAVALAINTLFEDCCEYNTLKADPKYLNSTYPFYGLIYEMNRYYLEELNFKYVNDGARSITQHSNIQPFLIDMFNFRKAYCQLQIEYKWWFNFAVKLLYPFRSFISVLKVKAILNMEAMRRGELYI